MPISGTCKVLCLRLDFSDKPGTPIAATDAARVFNTEVSPFFARNSFGALNLVATVSDRVYRMPKTAAEYEAQADAFVLHTDACTAAAADYPVSDFDLIVIVFPMLQSNSLFGSGFESGGFGLSGAAYSVINGYENFVPNIIEHELGHNFGLGHAQSLNAVDWPATAWRSKAYGDESDVMGHGYGHFNPSMQSLVGWLPQNAVAIPAAGRAAIRIYAQPDTAVPTRFPVTATFTDTSGVPYWVFPRIARSGGVGVTVVARPVWDSFTVLLETATATGTSQFMWPGDYFAEATTNTVVTVQATGFEQGVAYADCVFEVPTGATVPQITTAPYLTDARDGASLAAAVSGSAKSVRWEKRLAGSTAWLPLDSGDLIGSSSPTSITVRRTAGIADVRLIASNDAGQAVSNALHILARPLLSPTSVTVGASAQHYRLAVSSASDWSIRSNAAWLSTTPSTGTGPAIVDVTVDENDTDSAREAMLSLDGAMHTVSQSAADAEAASVYEAGAPSMGVDATIVTRPYKLGDGFIGMASPGIFSKRDGTRWALGRQMMRELSSDWMSSARLPIDRSAGIGRLVRVPDDVLAFGNDWGNGEHYTFVKRDGTVYVSSSFDDAAFDDVDRARPIGTNAVQLVVGASVLSYVNDQGELWAWGRNYYGEVGDGTWIRRDTPILVARNIAQVSAATHQQWSVDKNGAAYGMGKECFTELGTPIGFESGVRKVSAGGVHTIFLKTDGTAWGVGRNIEGQLGDGTWASRSTPTLMSSDIIDVSATLNATYLLRKDGVLLSCGANAYGQLGNGLTADCNRLVPIDTGVQLLFENAYLKTDGSLWVAGGTLTDAPVAPRRGDWVRVAGTARQVAAGRNISWMLDAGGRL